MQVLVIGAADQVAELGPLPEGFLLLSHPGELAHGHFDLVIDFKFEPAAAAYPPTLPTDTTIVVAALAATLAELPPGYVRINAWPGFLQGSVVEACAAGIVEKQKAEAVFAQMGKQVAWVPDVPGMISARVVAAIINEAYFALSEGVASRQDIDTAMKLGTAYPYGPFAWAEKIGLPRVAALLHKMAEADARYQPCPLLIQEAAA